MRDAHAASTRWLFRVAAGLACIVAAATSSVVFAAKPNVIFFLSDDVGYGDVGPAKQSNSPVPTPNIDRLAREGIAFTDAHTASSVCAPSRYSTLTGNNPYRGSDRWGVWFFNRVSDFRPGQKTVGDVMKAAGYRTSYFGKYHQGGDFYAKGSNSFYRGENASLIDLTRRFRNGPLDHGFDYSYVAPSGIQNQPYAYFEDDKFAPINPAQANFIYWSAGNYGNSKILAAGWGDANWDSSQFGPRVTQKAIDFIDRHYQQNLRDGTAVPFMMFFASQTIHGPNTPPPYFLGGVPVKGATGTGVKGDMIYEMDLQVGALMKAVQDRGLGSNTLFIFTSDNGGLPDPIPNHDSLGGLRGRKTLVEEGGHRVPFIARWGDGTPAGSPIKPGTRSAQLIGNHDWVATMYALTGQTMPEDQAQDSANLLPILLGQQSDATPLRSYLVSQAAHWGDEIHWQVIRQGQWSLLLDPNNVPLALYDLATDLRQNNNLISDTRYAARVTQMRQTHYDAVYTLPRTTPAWHPGDGTGPDPCGAPTYSPTVDRGLFIWKNCTTGVWQLRAVAGSGGTRFAGRIVSDLPFTSVIRRSIESNDVLDTSNPNQIAFNIGLSAPYYDGWDFTFSEEAHVRLELTSGGAIYLGASRAQLSSPAVLWDDADDPVPSPCGAPTYDPSTVAGLFLWQDCATGQWQLRGAAGGGYARFVGQFVSDAPFTLVTGYQLESSDVLDVSNPLRINFDLRMGQQYEDGLNFMFPAGAHVTMGLSTPATVYYGQAATPVDVPLTLLPGN